MPLEQLKTPPSYKIVIQICVRAGISLSFMAISRISDLCTCRDFVKLRGNITNQSNTLNLNFQFSMSQENLSVPGFRIIIIIRQLTSY